MTVLVNLIDVGIDVGRHLGLQRRRQHLTGALAGQLVQHRPTDRGRGVLVGLVLVVGYLEHGRTFPNQRANAGPDQSYLDFRSSSERYAPSRHPSEDHPQVLIIAREIAALRAQYEADGYTVVDYPAWGDEDVAFFHDLLTADGERITEENYAGKVGHAVAIGERWGSIDIAHVVVNWREHGLTSIRHSQPTTRSGAMTEEQKAERRRVVANNKAWVSAEKVRRAWVTKLLGRKRLPSQALAFAATVIADSRYEVARAANDGHDMAATLLGLDGQRHYGQPHPIAAMTQATPTKAGHALLAVALGALEAATDKNSWRNPDQVTRQYLDQLAALQALMHLIAHATGQAAIAAGGLNGALVGGATQPGM